MSCLSSTHFVTSLPQLLALTISSLKTYHLKYLQWKIQGISNSELSEAWKWKNILITLKFTHLNCASPPVGVIFISREFITSLPHLMPQKPVYCLTRFSAMNIIFLLTPRTGDLCGFSCQKTLFWHILRLVIHNSITNQIIFLLLYVKFMLFINVML